MAASRIPQRPKHAPALSKENIRLPVLNHSSILKDGDWLKCLIGCSLRTTAMIAQSVRSTAEGPDAVSVLGDCMQTDTSSRYSRSGISVLLSCLPALGHAEQKVDHDKEEGDEREWKILCANCISNTRGFRPVAIR